MKHWHHAAFAAVILILLPAPRAFAQVNLSGTYAMTLDEDFPERLPGPEIGDYLGIPLNENARAHAEAWDASLLTLPEYQCRVHPIDYVPSFFNIRIWEERDKDSQQLIALHAHHEAWGTERTIWMDGRPHPPDYALHTSQGFSTGHWDGEILTVTTTHLKQGWIRRNGIPRSDRAIVYENFIRHGDHLTWTTVIHDPAYLTEPFIRTRDFLMSPGLVMGAYPCESVVEVVMPKGKIPHHLPGTNEFLAEFPSRYGIPAVAAMGGAETMYPEYQLKLKTLPKPPPLKKADGK
ncbi:MAG TPA: hypothetical protein VG297_01560 [Bryobacteraceae bacterium]|jgi:hypothetical protein|nr:hypothetical protein [Bryobacteraceae bacterium]